MKRDKNAISISRLQPVGNFKEPLLSLRKKVDTFITRCHDEKTFNSAGTQMLAMAVEFISALEEGVKTGNVWNVEEAKKCSLYAHIIVIDINNVAQKYLNHVSMNPRILQLQDMLNSEKMYSIYGPVKLAN